MDKVRVIVVDSVTQEVREEMLTRPTLGSIQKIVNGNVDLIRDLVIQGVEVDTWVNDEFLFESTAPCYIGPFLVRGCAVLASVDPSNGDTVSLNDGVSVEDVREIVYFPSVH